MSEIIVQTLPRRETRANQKYLNDHILARNGQFNEDGLFGMFYKHSFARPHPLPSFMDPLDRTRVSPEEAAEGQGALSWSAKLLREDVSPTTHRLQLEPGLTNRFNLRLINNKGDLVDIIGPADFRNVRGGDFLRECVVGQSGYLVDQNEYGGILDYALAMADKYPSPFKVDLHADIVRVTDSDYLKLANRSSLRVKWIPFSTLRSDVAATERTDLSGVVVGYFPFGPRQVIASQVVRNPFTLG